MFRARLPRQRSLRTVPPSGPRHLAYTYLRPRSNHRTRDRSPAEIDTGPFTLSPRDFSSTCISTRPVQPLPSAKGWMVSSWACAIAACASTGTSSRRINASKSANGTGTCAWCGGTNSAPPGWWSSGPPIHTAWSRNWPATLARSLAAERHALRATFQSSPHQLQLPAASVERSPRSTWYSPTRHQKVPPQKFSLTRKSAAQSDSIRRIHRAARAGCW